LLTAFARWPVGLGQSANADASGDRGIG